MPAARLTKIALYVALAGALLCTAGAVVRSVSMASPGPLSRHLGDRTMRGGVATHAELEKRCEACHPVAGDTRKMSDLCLGCHDEIVAERRTRDGLHKRLGETSDCLACHTEHQGLDAEITHIQPDRFDHGGTGFALAAHRKTRQGADLRCETCHGERLTALPKSACLDCHKADQPDLMRQHAGAFGEDCRACHDGRDRFGKGRFTHAKAGRVLVGKHARAACELCHAGVRRLGDFATTPGPDATCQSCHAADAARGHGEAPEAKADCGGCHDASGQKGWQPGDFDHGKTGFPLTGKHADLACAKCHGAGKPKALSPDCATCHEAPKGHTQAGYGQECAGCHTTADWTPSRIENHRFPLNHGSRKPTPCATCHPKSTREYTCFGCHAHEPQAMLRLHRHEARAANLAAIQDCVRCHRNGGDGEEEGESHEGGEHDEDGESDEH